MESDDLQSLHGIKPAFREANKDGNSFIPCFFSQKVVVLCAENDGFIGKKRRFQPQETVVLETDSYFRRHQNSISF